MKRIALLFHVLLIASVLLTACGQSATPTAVGDKGTEAAPATEAIQAAESPAAQPAATESKVTEAAKATESSAAPAEIKKGGTLIAAYATDAKGVDPHKATNFSAFRVLELTYDTLLALDKELKVIPDLAESWDWSNGGKTLTMKLRKNVKFHSGNPLTSEDVKFSFERILDESTGAAARSYFTGIEKMETPDPYTIVFHQNEATVSLLVAMTNPNSAIIDMKAVKGGTDPAKEVVGSGPFKLVSWEPNQKLVLAANKDYWIPGQPYLDGIEFRTLPDESSILAALRTKQIDWAILADPRVAIAAGATGSSLVIDRSPALSYHVMQLNPTRPIFQDVRVRQAISCAIDRQQVMDTASLGEGELVGPVTPPFYRTPLSDLPCYTPDLEKAKKLLADAGVTNLKFAMMATNEEMPVTVAEAQNIQAQLKKIGVETTIDTVELGVFVDRWFKTDFDAVLTENGGNPDPDVMLYRYWHSTGNLQSVSKYNSQEIDKLLTEARTTPDVDKRKAIYTDVSKKLVEAAPWIWLYVGYQYRVMQPYVKGYTSLANGSAMFLRETWLDK